MTEYLHEVPGRLRVRSKLFRSDIATRNSALRKLRAMDGVSSVRLNHKAGSVTVYYNVDILSSQQILEFLEASAPMKKTVQSRKPKKSAVQRPKTSEWDFPREVGKIAFSVLVSRGVSYSLSTLLGGKA